MRLLLDTSVFLWVLDDHPRLSATARDLIGSADGVYVSAASIWEIVIKARLGKIRVDPGRAAQAIGACGFQELAITTRHALGVARLLDHHRDPFDRILVAQALAEPLRLVSPDAELAKYSELVIPV